MIRTLLDMLRLRSGPQDLPAGTGLAVPLVAAWIALGLLTDHVIDDPDPAPRSLFAIGFQLVVVILLLRARDLAPRIPQTISAMAGTSFLLGLVGLALLASLQPDQPQPGLALLYFGLFLWSLAVDGNIYRHALSINMSLGILVAVLIFAANFFLSRAAFG